MSKRDKLINKILKEQDITYSDAEKILVSFGYIPCAPQGGSSHITFRKSGSEKITLVKTQNPVKKYLIRQLKEIIENG